MNKNKMSAQLAKDILITALEGGIGYWSQCSGYHPNKGTVTIHELDDDDYNFISKTDLTYQMIQEKSEQYKEYAQKNLRCKVDCAWKDWDFDSEDADCFIQFVLFGEVRYG